MNRAVDILLLVVVCYLVYFGNLARHTYIKSEALRAIVVDEMLERDGFSLPTVHHAPYLNKPPLYAWTVTALSRRVGEFSEWVARFPSAVAGTALVLLMYLLGERWIGRGAGLAAGTFTLLCPTIADYAVRAELDLPFSFFCTCNIALTFAALRAKGLRAGLLWIAAYALVLTAAMWKGPHSLIFMWLVLFGYAALRKTTNQNPPRKWGADAPRVDQGDRPRTPVRGSDTGTTNWRWLRSSPQWIGLVATLGVLVWWTRALSAFAGPSNVGNIAAIELISRLVPYRVAHLVGIFTFIPMLLVITLPASLFAALTFSRRVRYALSGAPIVEPPSMALPVRLRAFVAGWWRWMRDDDRRLVLVAWLVPCLAFMLWAPAKAPRYSIPIFPPLILLGALTLVRLEGDQTPDAKGHAIARRIWRWLFALFGLVGLFAIARLIAGFAGCSLGIGQVDAWQPWAFLAAGSLVPIVVEVLHTGGRSLRTRLILSLAALLGCQPVLHEVWWPVRAAHDSQRATAKRIDEAVPKGARVYVLGDHEYHDVAIYADTPFEFADSLDDALTRAQVQDPTVRQAYAIFRTEEQEDLTAGATAEYEVIFNFDRLGKGNNLIEIETPD